MNIEELERAVRCRDFTIEGLRKSISDFVVELRKAEDERDAANARADRLAAYVRADDALFLTAVNESASVAERAAMDKARRSARAAVDAAGDLGGAA